MCGGRVHRQGRQRQCDDFGKMNAMHTCMLYLLEVVGFQYFDFEFASMLFGFISSLVFTVWFYFVVNSLICSVYRFSFCFAASVKFVVGFCLVCIHKFSQCERYVNHNASSMRNMKYCT